MKNLVLLVAAVAAIGLAYWRIVPIVGTFMPPSHFVRTHDMVKALPFDQAEIQTFLAAALQAEALSDPLQRCLAFPDPPGSHWYRPAVVAYCQLELPPALTESDVLKLIGSGRATELDRRLAAMARTLPERGQRAQLDQLFVRDFYVAEPGLRTALEAWKQQSPQSAYAYGASGCAYLRAAQSARGYAFADKTPPSNFVAMEAQLRLARIDLDKAVVLDPTLTPAYVAMIHAGLIGGDFHYAQTAAARGLAVDPANYAIHDILMTLVEPKWGGSLAAMGGVSVDAVLHAMTNPLLVTIPTDTAAYAAGYHGCACSDPVDLTAFRKVFDQLGNDDALGSAGTAASAAQRWDESVVYLAEALRFNPEDGDMRVAFTNDLSQLGETGTAIAEGNLSVAASPRDEWPYRARGYAYQQAQDFAKAEKDYGTALVLAPADDWIRSELGIIYVYSTHEWDKGWAVSQSLIDSHPEKSSGWVLRFSIQKDQPRPGMRETAKYLVDHFSEDSTAQNAIMDAQQILAVPPSHP